MANSTEFATRNTTNLVANSGHIWVTLGKTQHMYMYMSFLRPSHEDWYKCRWLQTGCLYILLSRYSVISLTVSQSIRTRKPISSALSVSGVSGFLRACDQNSLA